MPLTPTAVRRPVATLMVFLIIITLGLAGLRHLPIDLLPPIEYPELTVAVEYPNVGPQEMELIVTQAVENAIAGVPGVRRVRSRAEEGRTWVTLDFARGTNLDEAANDLRAAIDRLRGQLPPDAQPPRIWKFDPNTAPIVVVGVTSSDRDLQELTLILHREITRRFEQIPGVGTIDVWGGIYRQVHVDLHRDRLNASQLSATDVRAALGRGNVTMGGGSVAAGLQQLYVRTLGEYQDLAQIEQTVITRIGNQPIRVGDVADVSFGYGDLGRLVQINGRPMIRMGIRKQTDANTVTVAAAIRDEIERINRTRSDIQLLVVSDQSTFIERSIDAVRQSATWGALLAVFVLYIFLRRGRATFIIAVAIPISIIATFGLLYFNGLTLNQMSFGGLALGVGLVVDNAVVVLENITRMREQGRDVKASALIGTRQVTGAIIASTLTTTVIFLPVVFMQTISGVIFQQLALVVVFALLCSLLVALTLVPMLASKLLAKPGSEIGVRWLDWARRSYDAVETRYTRLLDFALRHRVLVLVATLLLLGGVLALAPRLPVELAPQTDADEVDVVLQMGDGTNIAVVDRYLAELEEIVRPLIPAGAVLHYTVDARDGRGEVELTMAPDSPIAPSQLADQLRTATIGRIPGGEIRAVAQSGLWILRRLFGSGEGEAITLELRGHDLEQARQLAERVQRQIEQIPGVESVRIGLRPGRPEEAIIFDRWLLSELGLSVHEAAEAIQINLGGSRAGTYRIGGDEFPLMVRLRLEDRRSIHDLDNIPLRLPGGEVIPISAVMDTEAARGPPRIDRVDGQRVTRVTADLTRGVALGDAVEAIRDRLADVPLPPGFSFYFGGAYEEQARAAADFRLSILAALLLVYMVMAGQFERYLDPLIVLVAVPLAIIGVVPTLLLTGTTINLQSLMGMMMLTGIVVNNAIVLVDYINLLRREEGLEIREAVRRAGQRRLRPILITTLTTVLGLLPLSFGWGAGAEIQAALARVVVGGLLASTLATLVFIPVVYLAAYGLLARLRRQNHP
jgi:hydrophobic/amphiphilic exporter-1 (mainly G- bacteria), HAE1 family